MVFCVCFLLNCVLKKFLFSPFVIFVFLRHSSISVRKRLNYINYFLEILIGFYSLWVYFQTQLCKYGLLTNTLKNEIGCYPTFCKFSLCFGVAHVIHRSVYECRDNTLDKAHKVLGTQQMHNQYQ